MDKKENPVYGHPEGVLSIATVGILSVLIGHLVKSGALKADVFLQQLDALSATPVQAPQTDDEMRMERAVFDLARQAVHTAQTDVQKERP